MHRSLLFIAVLTFFVIACSSSKKIYRSGDTRTTEVRLINDNTYFLLKYSNDKSYGYTEENPIKVGTTRDSSGPKNQRRFLNALLGPNGEPVEYFREGSCCPFKTPNGMFDNTGLLDIYRVYWIGGRDTLTLYLNMYDKGDLEVPLGFRAKQ